MYLLWLEIRHKNFEEQEIYGHYNIGIFKIHRMNQMKKIPAGNQNIWLWKAGIIRKMRQKLSQNVR